MVKITEHTVSYDSGQRQIVYLAAGPTDGPLLIFIHGWPAIAATWKPQLELFASLGFYVVAPDMPGYGKSTANKVIADYAHENLIRGLLAMLADTRRKSAVWVGHDWGSGVVSSLVATRPEVCRAMIWLAVPYGTLEYGLEGLVPYINRETYPEDQYPYGQWDYQVYYEESFDKATAFFDNNIAAMLRLCYAKGTPEVLGVPSSLTGTVRKDGGWFQGAKAPPDVPLPNTILDEELYNELVSAMQKTTFFPADAYYMNHARNREFLRTQRKNEGILNMPCLFVQAKYDICNTTNSTMLDPMKQMCKNFSFANVDSGHWVALEKPTETNAVLVKWLVKEVGDHWPGNLQNGLINAKL